jgi:hypothetical protein
VEYIHSHDVTTVGSTMTFNRAVNSDCTQAFGNMHDVTFRNNVIERGYGEGIYIAGNYQTVSQGGCPSWGNTHSDILIEGNMITDAGLNGGQGDGVDLKAGLMNVTVRGNSITRTHFGTDLGSCVVSIGIFGTARSNYVIEQNFCNTTNGIQLSYQNGTAVRNNVVLNARLVGTSGSGTIINYDVRLYNNTLINTPISAGDVDGFIIRNNILTGLPSGSTQINTWDSMNMDSDYNDLQSDAYVASKVNEGIHSQYVSPLTPQFVDPANLNYHLLAGSPAIDQGTDLTSTGFANDIIGTARPQGTAWDQGAYEFIPQ